MLLSLLAVRRTSCGITMRQTCFVTRNYHCTSRCAFQLPTSLRCASTCKHCLDAETYWYSTALPHTKKYSRWDSTSYHSGLSLIFSSCHLRHGDRVEGISFLPASTRLTRTITSCFQGMLFAVEDLARNADLRLRTECAMKKMSSNVKHIVGIWMTVGGREHKYSRKVSHLMEPQLNIKDMKDMKGS